MTLHAWLTARELEPLRKHLAGGHDQLALVFVLLVVIVMSLPDMRPQHRVSSGVPYRHCMSQSELTT